MTPPPPHAEDLRGCFHCGLVQRVPPPPAGCAVRCRRCDTLLARHGGVDRSQLCRALLLASLILYVPGILLPVMRLERMGHVQESSILGGGLSLLAHGAWLVGSVVLLCAVVIPMLKLLGMLLLLRRQRSRKRRSLRQRARLYHTVEFAGRWGMVDVLVVAVLVASLKLGDLVQVTPGPGLTAFTGFVVLSLLATACFDPHALWRKP